jgi:hypothetical protein
MTPSKDLRSNTQQPFTISSVILITDYLHAR